MEEDSIAKKVRQELYIKYYNEEKVFVRTLSEEDLRARLKTLSSLLDESRARFMAGYDTLYNERKKAM